jgi:hypothetical protein
MWREKKGLDKVEKGRGGNVMLRESLSDPYSIILHPLNSLLQFYIFAMFGL